MADTLGNKLGFKSSLEDPVLWYKPATDSMGNRHCSYMLVHVDDLLIIDKNPKKFMSQIQETFAIKPDSVEEPKNYLGADINKVHYADGSHAWTMGSES